MREMLASTSASEIAMWIAEFNMRADDERAAMKHAREHPDEVL